jgi:GH24 family phage-related lysozyme (muramidase)
MALIESSAKFFSAIHKRLHKSQRDEFRLLAKINHEFLPDEYPYDVPNITSSVFKSDFDGRVDVIPVSDPNIPSAAHRLSMAQMVLQLSSQAPQGMYNIQQVHLSILKAANVQNPERFFIPPQEPQPQDPIADIQSVVRGLPIKAFPQQDHEAHIAIKTSFIEDPTLGKTEMMAPVVPVLQANIQEHMVMKYQEEMSGVMQQEVSQVEQSAEVSPEVLSQLSIEAAQKVLRANEAMGDGSIPLEQQNLQLETARLDLEQQKMQLSATKDAADLALQNRELDIKEMSINQDHKIRALKDAGELKAKVDNSVRTTNAKLAVENIKNLIKERELMIKKRETETRYQDGGAVKFARGGYEEEILDQFINERGGMSSFDPIRWTSIIEALGGDSIAETTPSELTQSDTRPEVLQTASLEEAAVEQLPTPSDEQGTPMMPATSALDLIKEFEGFSPKPYFATEHEEKELKKSTIGFGDTQSGKTSVTEEEATEDVVERLNGHNEVLDETVEVDLTRGQRDSLLSLIDNVGEGAFKRSKALALLNEGDYEGAFREFFDPEKGFTRQNGEVLAGLVNRRRAEGNLFRTA